MSPSGSGVCGVLRERFQLLVEGCSRASLRCGCQGDPRSLTGPALRASRIADHTEARRRRLADSSATEHMSNNDSLVHGWTDYLPEIR